MSMVKVASAANDARDIPSTPQLGKRKGSVPATALAPRADLLPAEIGLSNRRRSARRGMRVVIVVAAVVAAAGVAGAWQYAAASNDRLASARQQSQQLAAQTGKFASIAKTIDGIALGNAAVQVGGATDIDWSDYLGRLQSTLPAGVSLKTVAVESAGVTTTFQQSTVPLEGSRIATITFTADSATIPSIPEWVDGLSKLPGFADASPDSVTQQDAGSYEAQVTMHVNTDAFSHRFDTKKESAK